MARFPWRLSQVSSLTQRREHSRRATRNSPKRRENESQVRRFSKKSTSQLKLHSVNSTHATYDDVELSRLEEANHASPDEREADAWHKPEDSMLCRQAIQKIPSRKESTCGEEEDAAGMKDSRRECQHRTVSRLGRRCPLEQKPRSPAPTLTVCTLAFPCRRSSCPRSTCTPCPWYVPVLATSR